MRSEGLRRCLLNASVDLLDVVNTISKGGTRILGVPTMKTRAAYDSDLMDAEWALIRPLVPPHPPRGNQPWISKREIVYAIFYINKHGCTCAGCRMTFPLGKRFTITFGSGPKPACGNKSTMPSAAPSAWRRESSPNQRPEASIANR